MRDNAPDNAHGPRNIDEHGVVQNVVASTFEGAGFCPIHVAEVAKTPQVVEQLRGGLEHRGIFHVALVRNLFVLMQRDPWPILGNLRATPTLSCYECCKKAFFSQGMSWSGQHCACACASVHGLEQHANMPKCREGTRNMQDSISAGTCKPR
jgi:hypothetical protein